MVGSYERIKVDIYISNPLRCFKCQQFGHGQRNCRSIHPACSFCGANDHKHEDCKSDTPKCANCSGPHASHSKECPRWQIEHEVQKIKAHTGVSFAEARRMLSGVDSTYDGQSQDNNATASPETSYWKALIHTSHFLLFRHFC